MRTDPKQVIVTRFKLLIGWKKISYLQNELLYEDEDCDNAFRGARQTKRYGSKFKV